jgi:peptidyl-prolyl cis-trans isomerase D
VEFGPSQMVSGGTQYSPARTRPFEEVKATVRERVVASKAAELARKEGEAKLAAWKANPASAQLGEAVTLSRTERKQPPKVIGGRAARRPGQAARAGGRGPRARKAMPS